MLTHRSLRIARSLSLFVVLAAGIAVLAGSSRAIAQEDADDSSSEVQPIGALLGEEITSRPLVVGTKQAAPFSYREGDGPWKGISIELWVSVAERLGLEYEFREMPLDELVTGLSSKQHDVSVAALTVTPDREAVMDFTHSFYPSGLGIAVPSEGERGMLAPLRGLISTRFFQAVGTLLVLILLAGALLWVFERRRNAEQFGGSARDGLGSAFWWSAVTMTTVGYGDKAPVTLGGRMVALVWMFASIITISGLTAAIASTLTLSKLELAVSGPGDLDKVDRIVCVAGSTGEDYLRERRLNYVTRKSTVEALAGVAEGSFGAMVYDAPILRYHVSKEFADDVTVLAVEFERQDYAIGLQLESSLRKPVNRAMLEMLSREEWNDVLFEHLGGE